MEMQRIWGSRGAEDSRAREQGMGDRRSRRCRERCFTFYLFRHPGVLNNNNVFYTTVIQQTCDLDDDIGRSLHNTFVQFH